MSTATKDIPLCFVGLNKKASIPSWAKSWHAVRSTVEELFSSTSTSGVAVIQSPKPKELESVLKKMSRDSDRLARTTGSLQFIVQWGATEKLEVDDAARLLKLFQAPAGRVDFAWGQGRLRQTVIEATAKFLVEEEKRLAQRPDPLAEAKEVIDATRFLLAPSGRLSAAAIAEAFDISVAKLGEIIGSSRQALAKTPDASAIQGALRPFERIARLRTQLSPANFLAWLHRPNRQLAEAAPSELIAGGRVGIVADLVEDMLLGTPG